MQEPYLFWAYDPCNSGRVRHAGVWNTEIGRNHAEAGSTHICTSYFLPAYNFCFFTCAYRNSSTQHLVVSTNTYYNPIIFLCLITVLSESLLKRILPFLSFPRELSATKFLTGLMGNTLFHNHHPLCVSKGRRSPIASQAGIGRVQGRKIQKMGRLLTLLHFAMELL